MCPTSNEILGVVNWGIINPIKKALSLGISVTINTGDPITFNTNIKKEIEIANLNQEELNVVIENGIKFAGKIF